MLVAFHASMEQMVQEFARAERDGNLCEKKFCYESDLQHGAFLYKVESSPEHNRVIVKIGRGKLAVLQ